MFYILVVAGEVLLQVSHPLFEGTENAFYRLDGENQVVLEAWEALRDGLHRYDLAIDKRVIARPFCATHRGKSIPQGVEKIIALEQLILVLSLKAVQPLAILATKSLKLDDSCFVLLNRPTDRLMTTFSGFKSGLILPTGLTLALE
jgi:hypothetical protein